MSLGISEKIFFQLLETIFDTATNIKINSLVLNRYLWERKILQLCMSISVFYYQYLIYFLYLFYLFHLIPHLFTARAASRQLM